MPNRFRRASLIHRASPFVFAGVTACARPQPIDVRAPPTDVTAPSADAAAQPTPSGTSRPEPSPNASTAPGPRSPDSAPANAPPANAPPANAPGASAPLSGVPIPETAAGRQLAAWLMAFNTADRQTLAAYHERHFPYDVASRDVQTLEREHGLSRGTGGFDPRRVEESEELRLVAIIQERNRPQYARVALEVSRELPHAVTRFSIGPIPPPVELLSPEEQRARTIDADTRRTALEAIGRELVAHYVSLETAKQVSQALRKKRARGDYDSFTDAVAFAAAVSRDLSRLARDKHIGMNFGPLPPRPNLEGPAPPWVAEAGYGFGPIERLSGNVAHMVIRGFPPLFESERRAIAERMSQITDADAVILDLRENNGGFPRTVLEVASYFFGEEPVHLNSIYRRDTNTTSQMWTERALPGPRYGATKPVYVVTSARTFSGGEGLAYALQAQGRAIVVGEPTGGGAHPTEPRAIPGGFVLRVPWGRSIHPFTGTNWEGIGIVPDIPTPEGEALDTAHRLALEKLGRR